MKSAGLSNRDTLLVAEYVAGKPAEHAAVAAGFSKSYARKNAYELIRRPKIAAAIKEAQDKIKEKSLWTAEKLLTQIQEDRERVIAWKQGTALIRADEMIGRITGIIEDKTKVELEVGVSLIGAIEEAKRRAATYRISNEPAPRPMIDITPSMPVTASDPFGD